MPEASNVTPPDRLDVLVAGAGYVGLAVAVAIKSARPSLSVAIVDAAPAGVWQRDGRASAIAAAASRMLDRLDCWAEIAPEAQAITDMIVTDSRTSDPVRPVFLTFGGEIAPGEPFAHMVDNKVLNGALRRKAGELGIDLLEGIGVIGFEETPGGLDTHLADGTWPWENVAPGIQKDVEALIADLCDGNEAEWQEHTDRNEPRQP